MKGIKIHIKELGAIKDSFVEIKPLVVISGESGLGKSYVAILIHYFYKLLEGGDRLGAFFDSSDWSFESLSAKTPGKRSFSFKTSQLIEWINQDIKDYMGQALGNPNLKMQVEIDLPIDKSSFQFKYRTVNLGPEGKEEPYNEFVLDQTVMRLRANSSKIGSFPWSLLLQEVLREQLFGDSYLEQTFAMVPGRGALLNVPLTVQERIKANGDIYSEFLSDWVVVRSMPAFRNRDESLLNVLHAINGGSIAQDSEKNIVYQLENNEQIPISAAASSIKELAPLYMLLDKYPAKRLSILFEEPEAHLHPQKQINIADFVVQAINSGSHMQITTHSDYFLRRINDRIVLHKINSIDSSVYKETIREYGYSDLSLDPSLVGAYFLQRQDDGSVKVVSQGLENGIPYESFYEVIQNDVRHSMDLQQVYFQLVEPHAESDLYGVE